jgi:hypothetical protein
MKLVSTLRVLPLLTICVAVFAPGTARAEETAISVDARPAADTRLVLPVAGATAFLSGYLPSATVGAVSLEKELDETIGNPQWSPVRLCNGLSDCPPPPHFGASALLIPVAGPLLYARPDERDDQFRKQAPPSNTERALLYADGAVQAGGLAVFTVGVARLLASSTSSRVDKATDPRSSAWSVVPSASPQGSSVSVVGAF